MADIEKEATKWELERQEQIALQKAELANVQRHRANIDASNLRHDELMARDIEARIKHNAVYAEYLKQHNAMSERQAIALERIAAALEKANG